MKLACVAVALLVASTSVVAQTHVTGRVTTRAGARIRGVSVMLHDSASGRLYGAISDTAGEFDVVVPNELLPRTFYVRTEMLGYGPVEDAAVEISATKPVVLELELDEDAVEVSPLKVTARKNSSVYLDDFARRAENVKKGGGGYILNRVELERGGQQSVARVLASVPGLRYIRDRTGMSETAISTRGNCIPQYYLDGTPLAVANIAMINSASLEGVEVYYGPSSGPAEYFDRRGCGVVLMWSQRGSPQSNVHYPIIGIGIILSIAAFLIAK